MKGKYNFLRAFVFLLPSFVGMIVFTFVPVAMSLFISMTNWRGMSRLSIFNGFFVFVKKNFVGPNNYAAILKDSEIWRVLGHNLYFIVLYIPLMMFFSLLVAGIISPKRKGVGIYRILYYLPVLTSWVAGSLIWKWLLSPVYGPINNILAIIGIKGPSWLQSEVWAMPSIVFASVWKDMGFFGMIFLGGLLSISPEYYESAEIDGARPTQKFLKITLPLLSPITFYVVMLSVINSFQLFPQIMVMAENAGPNGATQVMVERIYKYAFMFGRMGHASAFSWILFAIIFICTAIQNYVQKNWVYYE